MLKYKVWLATTAYLSNSNFSITRGLWSNLCEKSCWSGKCMSTVLLNMMSNFKQSTDEILGEDWLICKQVIQSQWFWMPIIIVFFMAFLGLMLACCCKHDSGSSPRNQDQCPLCYHPYTWTNVWLFNTSIYDNIIFDLVFSLLSTLITDKKLKWPNN